MPFAESSIVPANQIYAQFLASIRSRAYVRAFAASRKRSLKIHLLMVITLVLLWKLIGSPNVVLILGGCVFLAGSLVIARNEARSTPLLITPLSWWFVWQAIALGLSPIWIGSRLGEMESVGFVNQTISIDNVIEGFICYAIGSLALHLGLQCSRPKEYVAATQRNASSSSLAAIIVLWVCGIFFLLFGRYFTLLGTIASPLQWCALSAACSIAIAPPRSIPARSYIHWCAILIAIAGCVVAQALVGLKSLIMLSALPLVWLFMLRRNLRKVLLVLIPALALTYIYIVEPVIDNLRYINQSADIRGSLIENTKEGHLGDVAGLQPHSMAEQLDGVASRDFRGTYVGYFVQDTKAHGLKMGATMDYLLYAFIPRVFWPEKPNVSRGAWFTAYLGMAHSEDTATSASALTAEGELYWNFGLAGMIAGMTALGWLIGRLLWQTAGADPRANPICMFALLVTMSCISGEAEAGTLLLDIISSAILLRLMLKSYEMFGKHR